MVTNDTDKIPWANLSPEDAVLLDMLAARGFGGVTLAQLHDVTVLNVSAVERAANRARAFTRCFAGSAQERTDDVRVSTEMSTRATLTMWFRLESDSRAMYAIHEEALLEDKRRAEGGHHLIIGTNGDNYLLPRIKGDLVIG